ncbi:MAG: DUF4279 domain-containing protein [Acidobacteria bacterium]|nr:DUF4279 domain-containing protein [Acidobacteriota bacterium]
MISEGKKWHQVSLRFSGERLHVEDIEEKLNLTPSYIGKKGEHIRGNPKYAKHDSNIWVWQYPSSSDALFEDQIAELMDIVEPKIVALKEIPINTRNDRRSISWVWFWKRTRRGGFFTIAAEENW